MSGDRANKNEILQGSGVRALISFAEHISLQHKIRRCHRGRGTNPGEARSGASQANREPRFSPL
jgi:hypothetical protein